VRIVYETKSFVLQMNGEFQLSFNKMQFWNNTHTHTHTHTHIYIYIYIYIYTYAPYILNIDTNIYLITPLEKALLEKPAFYRQVGCCSVHYKLNTSWLLEAIYWTLKQHFWNLLYKSNFEISYFYKWFNCKSSRVTWSQTILNQNFADILFFYVVNYRFS